MVLNNVFSLVKYELTFLRKEYKLRTTPIEPNKVEYKFSKTNEQGRIEYTVTVDYKKGDDIIYFSVYQTSESRYDDYCESGYNVKVCYVEEGWYGDTEYGKWDMIVGEYKKFINKVKVTVEEMNKLV